MLPYFSRNFYKFLLRNKSEDGDVDKSSNPPTGERQRKKKEKMEL